jgi:hypothetical protein
MTKGKSEMQQRLENMIFDLSEDLGIMIENLNPHMDIERLRRTYDKYGKAVRAYKRRYGDSPMLHWVSLESCSHYAT